MEAPPTTKQKGAALITVLILASAIAIVVTGLFAIRGRDVEISSHQVHQTSAVFGEKAAFAAASSLLEGLTQSDDYVISVAVEQGPDGPSRFTFLSQPSATQLTHTPLFSGGRFQSVGMPRIDAVSKSALLNSPVEAPNVALRPGATASPIELPGLSHLSAAGELIEEDRFPEIGLIDLPQAEDSKFRTRYGYWIEDLEGYPNLDVVSHRSYGPAVPSPTQTPEDSPVLLGYSGFDPRLGEKYPVQDKDGIQFGFPEAFREQDWRNQVAPGLSPKEINLFPWPLVSAGPEAHPFSWIPDRFDNFNLSQTGLVEARYSTGLLPYEVIPRIPFGHGYADEGQVRHNLNQFIRNRDLSLVDIIERNLPEFEDRKGGFPDNENYLATLAANMIDYADQDGNPTVRSNSINPPDTRDFRGVDAYCPVNELFIRFAFEDASPVAGTDGREVELTFSVTLFVELWNTSNQPTAPGIYTIDFQFLNAFEFENPTLITGPQNTSPNWNTLTDEDIEINAPRDIGITFVEQDPAEPQEIVLAPNEIRMINFGQIIWKKTVLTQPSDIVFPGEIEFVNIAREPIPQPNDYPKHEIMDAGYQLRYNGFLVDSPGRTLNPITRNDGTPVWRHGFFVHTIDGRTVITGEGKRRRISIPLKIDEGGSILRVAAGNRRVRFGNQRSSHLGDPWMNYFSQAKEDNHVFSNGYVDHSSPGFRNIGFNFLANRSNNAQDIIADQVRVRDWPDGGYDNALDLNAADGSYNSQGPMIRPDTEEEIPSAYSFPSDPARAPWRLSQQGRFYSLTELGHLHDPVMWFLVDPGTSQTQQRFSEFRDKQFKSLPKGNTPASFWGGGNTLRIGRPEHDLFDEPGMRASQLLDIFQVGETGTNLPATNGTDQIYRHYDPKDHHPPRTAPDEAEALENPYALVYAPNLHAEGTSKQIYGELNINSVPTQLEIETLLRGPLVSNHLVMNSETMESLTPIYSDEISQGKLEKTLDPDATQRIARDLFRLRPYYSPSHLARVFTYLLDEYDALPEFIDDTQSQTAQSSLRNLTNDAESEESFARLFNLTTFSSRHFRIHTYSEIYHIETGAVLAKDSGRYDVFLERDDSSPPVVETKILARRE